MCFWRKASDNRWKSVVFKIYSRFRNKFDGNTKIVQLSRVEYLHYGCSTCHFIFSCSRNLSSRISTTHQSGVGHQCPRTRYFPQFYGVRYSAALPGRHKIDHSLTSYQQFRLYCVSIGPLVCTDIASIQLEQGPFQQQSCSSYSSMIISLSY